MDVNAMKERFSFAYIEAVASRAGYQLSEPRVDRDSVDGILSGNFGTRPRIEFQAKATSQEILKNDHLSFPLPVNNYEDLRADTRVPRILIVLRMPHDISEWLNQTGDELCMRYCAYWLSLEGLPAASNTSTVSVHVPLANMFNSEQLSDLMDKVDRGESL